MAVTINIPIKSKSQDGIVAYAKTCVDYFGANFNITDQLRDIDLAYQREHNWTVEHKRAELANKYGDATRFQDQTVPVVMPQVEAAVAYQTSVFLTGVPLFGVISSPKFQDAALQMETLIDNQAIKGGWVQELIKAKRDGFKYNLCAIDVYWDAIKTPSFITDTSFDVKEAKVQNVTWEGNVLKRLDMYNTFWDTRVNPCDVAHEAEFAGYHKLISRTALKKLIADIGNDRLLSYNIRTALESATPENLYITPDINPDAVINKTGSREMDWSSWVDASSGRNDISYRSHYILTKLYARIIPSDFDINVPNRNTPQIWSFLIVNMNTVLLAERLTNAHNLIPIIMASPLDDGLGYQTKSFANNLKPIQHFTSAMLNSVVASRRRAISDRTLYNPLLVDKKHLDNPNPSANIPVRPSAYGRDLREAVYPFPYNDNDSLGILQNMPMFTRFADQIAGQNPAAQGQFVKGNKTRYEYEDIMSNSNGRSQLAALMFESQLYTPLKEILKINILQYQGVESVYSREKEQEIEIDPVALRTAVLEFKLSDGLIPSSKLINGDAFQTAIQVIGSSQQLSTEYNLGPMFSYLMKTQGAVISSFEKTPEQLQYEKAIGSWQQTIMQLFKDNPEITQEQLPPQPKLEDFGMDAQGNVIDKKDQQKQPTILEQVIAGSSGAASGAA